MNSSALGLEALILEITVGILYMESIASLLQARYMCHIGGQEFGLRVIFSILNFLLIYSSSHIFSLIR